MNDQDKAAFWYAQEKRGIALRAPAFPCARYLWRAAYVGVWCLCAVAWAWLLVGCWSEPAPPPLCSDACRSGDGSFRLVELLCPSEEDASLCTCLREEREIDCRPDTAVQP